MDVLYLATFDPTVRATGTATRGHLFLDRMADQFSVHLVHMTEQDRDGRDASLKDRLASLHRVDHTKLGYFLWSPELYRTAAEVLDRYDCRVIFADFEKAGYYATRLSRKFRVPFIYSSHNVEFRRYLDLARKNPARVPLVPLVYWMERSAVEAATTTIAISERGGEQFRRWTAPDRVRVLPCAFDEEVYHPHYEDPAERDGRSIVLLVGNYRNAGNRQAAEVLLEEIRPAVLREMPETLFRCVGKHFPAELAVDGVEAPGFVEDLRGEYRRASVVAAPVLMGGGIKIKVIEALACGRPIVATEKAFEGISHDNLSNVSVGPIGGMPEAIVRFLDAGAEKTKANWNYLRKHFGTRTQLEQVQELVRQAAG